MKFFDFVIVGGGISGLITSYFLRGYNTLLIDKSDILSGASGAAGAFLFPKIGLKSAYTDFVNEAIIEAVDFYKNIGIDTHTRGVLILPRDEKDISKFKEYEKFITLPFKKIDNGFFFKIGSFIEPNDVKKLLKVPFKRVNLESVEKKDNYWVINNTIKTKNIIFANGYSFKNEYINIRPIWGERIEIVGDFEKKEIFYHKNVSVALINNKLRIGATHKRGDNFKINKEEAFLLVKKAKEIINIKDFEIDNIKGGYRAGSIDYFPVVGKIIDVRKTILNDKYIIKGDMPKDIFYKEGLYVINGMGGRGYSNALKSAKYLKDVIENSAFNKYLDTKRLFIKWARKKGEEYLDNLFKR